MTWRYGVEVLLYLILGLEVVSLFCLLYILAPYFRSPASDRPVKVISDEYIRRLDLEPGRLNMWMSSIPRVSQSGFLSYVDRGSLILTEPYRSISRQTKLSLLTPDCESSGSG